MNTAQEPPGSVVNLSFDPVPPRGLTRLIAPFDYPPNVSLSADVVSRLFRVSTPVKSRLREIQ
jgi:hypothetical protein